MLIDWLTFDLPYRAARVFSQEFFKPWDSDFVQARKVRWHVAQGPYGSSAHILCVGGRMEFSGNPVKFLTGQNVFGSDDLNELILRIYEAMLVICDVPDCRHARAAILDGSVNLRRVDVTNHWHVGTNEDCRFYLEALGSRGTLDRRGRGHFNSDFCSIGWGFGNDRSNGENQRGSRRTTLKLYNKFDELRRNPMGCDHVREELLTDWVCGKVRVEACYRGMEMTRLGFKRSGDWDQDSASVLLQSFLSRLSFPDQITFLDDVEAELPRMLRLVYHSWLSGVDVKAKVSKSAFYRYRRQLLEHGVDISIPKVEFVRPGRTVQLDHVLKGEPSCFPDPGLLDDMMDEGLERLKHLAKRRKETAREAASSCSE